MTRPFDSSVLPDARGLHVALVVSRYHHDVTHRLQQGAVAALREAGVADEAVEVFAVPGTFEITLAARHAAETGRFDAIVCLGCVIKGETLHFEFIASAVAHGITTASAETGIPMAFGVLTTNSIDEAIARAGDSSSDFRSGKGWEAAMAAVELATVCRGLTRGEPTGESG